VLLRKRLKVEKQQVYIEIFFLFFFLFFQIDIFFIFFYFFSFVYIYPLDFASVSLVHFARFRLSFGVHFDKHVLCHSVFLSYRFGVSLHGDSSSHGI